MAAALFCMGGPARSQYSLALIGREQISEADQAALSKPETLGDLPCRVTPDKPVMGIDLQFHTGYSVAIPLKALAPGGRELRSTVRVTPVDEPGRTAFFASRITSPPVDPATKGDAELSGQFAVGPGRYKIDWIMRDDARVCSAHWRISAKLDKPFQQVSLAIPSGAAAALPEDPFYESDRKVQRAATPLYVKVLVNFTPAGGTQQMPDSERQHAITSILRGVAREPRFGRFSLVAFSVDLERVTFRQPPAPNIDFGGLGRIVRTLPAGTIELRHLQERESAARFLSGLLAEELGPQEPVPDAIVVVTPKVSLDQKLAEDELRSRIHVPCPIFFLQYVPDPKRDPWSGAISEGMKVYNAVEYTIAGPRDLGNALKKMASQLQPER